MTSFSFIRECARALRDPARFRARFRGDADAAARFIDAFTAYTSQLFDIPRTSKADITMAAAFRKLEEAARAIGIDPMANDEATHRQALIDAGIVEAPVHVHAQRRGH